MNDFYDTTYNSLTIFLCIPTYHKCVNLKKNSSLLLIYSVYAHTFLLTCQLQICSNLFRLILAYIRDQIPNTILCLNSPFAPYYSTYGAAPDLSSLSLFITYYPTYAPLPNSIDPHSSYSITICYDLLIFTVLFLYDINLYILYSIYILHGVDYF